MANQSEFLPLIVQITLPASGCVVNFIPHTTAKREDNPVCVCVCVCVCVEDSSFKERAIL